jgi:hypothetical protein
MKHRLASSGENFDRVSYSSVDNLADCWRMVLDAVTDREPDKTNDQRK